MVLMITYTNLTARLAMTFILPAPIARAIIVVDVAMIILQLTCFFDGERLGKIKTQGGFVDEKMPGWISNWQGNNKDVKKPIADTTAITIISPACRNKDGVSNICYTKGMAGKIRIDHAPTEHPNAVLDKIYHAIVRSKQKAAAAKKLSKLNLAVNKVQDNGREK